MKVITYPDKNIITSSSLLVEFAKSMPILFRTCHIKTPQLSLTPFLGTKYC
jgi:hypothetical protein